jgi:general L-amino acid transport system permease protein
MAGLSILPDASWHEKAGYVIRKRVIATPAMAAVNLVIFAVLAWITWQAIDWAFLGAGWGAEQSASCPEAEGACWSVIAARHRLVLFGLYPCELH